MDMVILDVTLGKTAENCLYHKEFEIKPHECYKEFSINDEEYKIGDNVIFKEKNNKQVGTIICMFMNESGTFHIVIEDQQATNSKRKIYLTELNNILQKCNKAVYSSGEFYNSHSNKASSDANLFTTLTSPLLHDQTPAMNSTPIYLKDVDKDDSTLSRTVSTPRRNSVKRNLNKSFGNVHDYSIVEPAGEKSLKVIIRKSKRSLMKQIEQSPSVRKSKRNIPRKSYADYESPLKCIKSPADLFPFAEQNSKVARRLGSPIKEITTLNGLITPARKYISKDENTPARSSKAKRSITYHKSDSSGNESDIPTETVLKNERTMSFCELEKENLQENSPVNKFSRTTLKVCLDKLHTGELERKDDKCINDESERIIKSFHTATLRIHLNKLDKDDLNNIDREFNNKGDHTYLETEHGLSSNARKSRVSEQTTYMKTPRSKRNLKPTEKPYIAKTPVKTPKNRAKLIREGLITPSIQSRSKAVEGDHTPLMKARSQLHVSYVPKTLPCREKEYADVYGFLRGKLIDGCGGCMYVSGVPGTGKTATVSSVINSLQLDSTVPNFNFININGMRLTEPRQTYVEILKQLMGKVVPWEQAQNELESIFIKSRKQKPIVMLIDELDILCTKRQDVVYNLLDWPAKAKSQLVVITIANTMDLPERLLMSRVTSRLGLTRLTFQAYTYKQLQDIITMRLYGTDTFNPDAVQFVARKVASVSGDARRALDICRRAAEIAQAEGKEELVNMAHVNDALNLMITQPKVQAIRHCSILEQLILQSIVTEVERTGVEETNFSDVYKMLVSHAAIEGFPMVSISLALTAISKLGTCRLILTDSKCNNIHQRIVLNVSVDDVFYALKND